MAYRAKPEADLFWRKVVITPGCWLWTGHVMDNGYGLWRGTTAHRAAYRLTFGEALPPHLHLDHLKDRCSRRDCVNVLLHLEPVTQAENNRRSHPGPQSHCGKGHAMTPENVYESKTSKGRQCRRCAIDRAITRNRRIRGESHV
jgi:hypothetical protein